MLLGGMVDIRKAKHPDFGKLIFLLNELGYSIPENEFSTQANTYINSPDCELLVAEVDGKGISGMIAGHLFPLIHQPGNVGRIMAFIVSKDFRSLGVGSALLESLESWFRDNKCQRFEVNSGDHREDAHGFYISKGYQIDERRFIKLNAT
jgi:GNAT superfamily N-acetyltransferase